MYAVTLGVVLWVLYALDIAPVARWDWWWLLLPFAVAVVWWEWSDASGRTRRLQEERMAQRVRERRSKSQEWIKRSGSGRAGH